MVVGMNKLVSKIERWRDVRGAGTIFTYSLTDSDFIDKTLLFDVLNQTNKRIASYMARRYIEKNRERIEQFVKHASVRRHIEREIRRFLEDK